MTTLPLASSHGHGSGGQNNCETAACHSWVHPECTLKQDSKWSVLATTHEQEPDVKEEGIHEEKTTTTIPSDGGVPILTAMCPLHKKSPTYCSCKKIDDGTDDFVECDSCCDWFHYKCEGVDPDNPPSMFTCRQCRKRNGKVPQSERLENRAKMASYDSELAGSMILKVGCWLGEVQRSLQLPTGGELKKEEEVATATIRHQSTTGISFQTLCNYILMGKHSMKSYQHILHVGKEGYETKGDDDIAVPTFLQNRVHRTVTQLEKAKHDILTWQKDVEDWKNVHIEPYMKISAQGRNNPPTWNISIKDLEHEIEQLEGFLATSLSLLCRPVGLECVERSKGVALWMLKVQNLFIHDEDTTTGGSDMHDNHHHLKENQVVRPPASELQKLTLEGQGLRIGSAGRETIAWRHILNLSTVAKAWLRKAEVMLANLQGNGTVQVRLSAIESHLMNGLALVVSFPECQKLEAALESWNRWSEEVNVLISEKFPPGQSLFCFRRNKILEMKSDFDSFLFLATNLLTKINSSNYSTKAPTRDKLIQCIRSIYWVKEAQTALDSAERAGAVRWKVFSDGVGANDMVDQRPLSSLFTKLLDDSLGLRGENPQQQSIDNPKFNGQEEEKEDQQQQQNSNAAGSGSRSEEGRGILHDVEKAASGGPVVLLAKELLAKMEITSRRNVTHRPLFPTEKNGFSSEPEAVLASLQKLDVRFLEEDIISHYIRLISWEEEVWRVMTVEEPLKKNLPTVTELKAMREAGSLLMKTLMSRGMVSSAPTFIQEAFNDLDERLSATEHWVTSTNDLIARIRARDKPLCELSNPLHEAINAGKRLRVSVAERLKQLHGLTLGDGEKEWEKSVHSVLIHGVFRKPLALYSSEAGRRLIMLNGLLESGNGVFAHPVLMKVIKFLVASEMKQQPLPPYAKDHQAGPSVEIYRDDLPVDSLFSYITEGERMVDLDVFDSDSGIEIATFIAASTAVKERLVYLHGRVWSAKATALIISPAGHRDSSSCGHVALLSDAKRHITRFSESFAGLEGFETKRLALQAEIMNAEKVDSEFAEVVDSTCCPPSTLATGRDSGEAGGGGDISLIEMSGVQALQKNLKEAEAVLAAVKTGSSEAGLVLQTEAEKRASNYVYALSMCINAVNLGAHKIRLPLDRICEMGGEKLKRSFSDYGVIVSNYFFLDDVLSKAENISVLASSWMDRVSAFLTPKIPDVPSQETAKAISGVILGRCNALDTEEVRKCSSNMPPKFVTLNMLRSEVDAYTVSLLAENDNFLVSLKSIIERASQWGTAAMDVVGLVSDPRTKLVSLTEILEKGRGLPARLPCWSIIYWVYSVLKAHLLLEKSRNNCSNRNVPLDIAQGFATTYADLVAVVQSSAPEEETEDPLPLLAFQAAAECLMPTAATRSTIHPLRRLCDESLTALIAFNANVERANEEINHLRDLFRGIIDTDESTGGLRLTSMVSAIQKVNSEALGTALSNLRDIPDVIIHNDLITVLYRALKLRNPYHAELKYAPQDSLVDVSEVKGGQQFKSQLKMRNKENSTVPLAVAAQGSAVPRSRQQNLKDPILSQLRVCSKCRIGKKGRMSCRVVQKHWVDPDWPALPNSEKWKPPEGFWEWFEAHSKESPLLQRGDKLLPASSTQTLSTTSPQQPATSSQHESVASKLPCVRSDCNATARAGSVFCSLLCEVRSGEENLNALLELKRVEATKWVTTNHGHMSESLSQTVIEPETENAVTEFVSKLKSTKGEVSLITDRTPFGHVGCDVALNRLSKTAGDGATKGRRKVMARFESLFLSGMLYMGLVPDSAFCHTLAWNLENELHERFPLKSHSKQYKDKRSSLIFNLQASKNPTLFKDVILGMDLGKLCKMSATEMAPSDQQREMRRLKEEAVGQHWIRETSQGDDMIWDSEQGALMHKSQIGRENTTLMASNLDLNPDSMTPAVPRKSSTSLNKRALVDLVDEVSKSVYSLSLKKSRDSSSSDLHQGSESQGIETSGLSYSSLDDVLSPQNVSSGMLGDEANERTDASSKAAPAPVLGFADSQSSTLPRSPGSSTILVEEELVPPNKDEGDVIISHGFSSSVNKVVEAQVKQKNEWGKLCPGMVELNPDDAPEGRNGRFLINDPTSKTRFFVRALAKAGITSKINPILKHTWEVCGRATGQQALDLLSRSTSEGKKKYTLVIIPVEVGTFLYVFHI